MANPEPKLPPHPLARQPAPASGRPGASRPGTGRPGGGPRKGLSSSAVALGSVGLLASLIIGVSVAQDVFADQVTSDCVDLGSRQADGSYRIVGEDYCDDDHHGYGGSHGAYSWYYGGVRQAGRVLRGTTIRPANAHVTSRSGSVLQRGGFGGRGSSGS